MSTISSPVFLNVAVRTPLGHARSMLYKCSKCKKENIQLGEALLPGSGIPGSEMLKLYQLVGDFPSGTTPFIDPMRPLNVGALARIVLCSGCATRKDLRLLKVVTVMDKWVEQNNIFANEFGEIPVPAPPPELRPEDQYLELARTWPGLACGHCRKAMTASEAYVPSLDKMYEVVHPGCTSAPPLEVCYLARQAHCSRCACHGSFTYMKASEIMARWHSLGHEWHKSTKSTPRVRRHQEVEQDIPFAATEKPNPQHRHRRKEPRKGAKRNFKKGKKQKK